MAHIHAESMRLYAEDAAKYDKPWELWEGQFHNLWIPTREHPRWNEAATYRRKRKMNVVIHIIDGVETRHEYPAPSHEEPRMGAEYWVMGREPSNTCLYRVRCQEHLDKGIYLSRADAETAYKALNNLP